jgi:hypothetical protein
MWKEAVTFEFKVVLWYLDAGIEEYYKNIG